MNETKHELMRYFGGVALASVLVVILLTIARSYLYPEEMATIHFYLIKRSVVALFANCVLPGGLIFMNAMTRGDYLKKIEESSIACALIACTTIIMVGYMVCYA
jgi:hypothetical protein